MTHVAFLPAEGLAAAFTPRQGSVVEKLTNPLQTLTTSAQNGGILENFLIAKGLTIVEHADGQTRPTLTADTAIKQTNGSDIAQYFALNTTLRDIGATLVEGKYQARGKPVAAYVLDLSK